MTSHHFPQFGYFSLMLILTGGEDWYMSRGSMGVEVSVPYFLFPLSDSISSSSLLVSDGDKGQNLSSTLSILSSFFWCV
jgi:hypothetical protein